MVSVCWGVRQIYVYVFIDICAQVHAGANLCVQLYILRAQLNIKWLPQLSILRFKPGSLIESDVLGTHLSLPLSWTAVICIVLILCRGAEDQTLFRMPELQSIF